MKRICLILACTLALLPLGCASEPSQREDGTLKVYHADLHSRSRAKILVTVTAHDADRLLMLLTSPDGTETTLVDAGAPTDAETHVATLDLESMSAGTYVLVTRVLDGYGHVVAEKVRSFDRAIDGTPRVAFDENNALLVEGQHVFPVFDWQNAFPRLAEDGARHRLSGAEGRRRFRGEPYDPSVFATHVDGCDIARIAAVGPSLNGSDAYELADWVAASRDKPALLAWEWLDEPEYSNVPPERVREWTRQTHALDPQRPVVVNLVGSLFVDQGGSQDRARSYTADLVDAERPAVADWISTDYYPIAFMPNFQMSLQQAFDNFAEHLLNVRTWTKDLYPMKTFIELTSQPSLNSAVVPTPDQVWAESWIAIVHGCRALSWFAHDGQMDPRTPAVQTKVVKYVTHFTPQLAQPDSKRVDRVLLEGDRVDFMAKDHGGRVYLFAVNRNVSTPATVRFLVKDFRLGRIKAYDESRELTPEGDSFTDTFEPYAVHIYILEPDRR